MKRKVKVDLDELAMALNTGFPELHQYLDLETGDIVAIPLYHRYRDRNPSAGAIPSPMPFPIAQTPAPGSR